MTIQIFTDFPIAYDSPDHLIPLGAKADDHRNSKFISRCEQLLSKHDIKCGKILDIGCAGGGCVEDFLNRGHDVYGIEGSDYSQKTLRASWKSIPERLYTADASRPFIIMQDNAICHFDIIYSFEVMEHIPVCRLPIYFSNIHLHLKPNGLFIGSFSCSKSQKFPTHHQTIMNPKQWKQFIGLLGLFEVIDLQWDKADYLRYSSKKRQCCPISLSKKIYKTN